MQVIDEKEEAHLVTVVLMGFEIDRLTSMNRRLTSGINTSKVERSPRYKKQLRIKIPDVISGAF